MKRQFYSRQYGFTLIELVIVMVIIGIFVAATSTMSWKPQTETEKVNRMKDMVSSTLRDETLKMSIGRMPKNNGTISNKTVIRIGTGGIITEYYDTGGTIFASGAFLRPFFDKDTAYSLSGVLWLTGTTTSTATSTSTGEIIITPSTISFSGTNITSENILLQIIVGYNNRTRKIEFDRRTGRIATDS